MRHFRLERYAPSPELGRFVDRFWKTEWQLAEPFVQTIVTYPVVNLVVQADGSAVVSGVQRENDERRIDGTGWAFGVMFRPGGFRCLVDGPMLDLVDRRVPASDLFGPAADVLADAVVAAAGDPERIMLTTRFLLERLPGAPTVGEELSALVEAAAEGSEPVTRASELAARHGVSLRTLQRLFAEHVGIGPKAVLDRYRVQRAAEAALSPVTSWADVAQRLGYADQAHLTADLSGTFGAPPDTYAREESGERRRELRAAVPVGVEADEA